MPGLIVVIGGNSAPFQKELLKAEAAARATAKRIEAATRAGGESRNVGGGILNIGKVFHSLETGALTHLPHAVMNIFEKFGLLNPAMSASAKIANTVADSYGELAKKAGEAEIAALKKAQASALAMEADLSDTEATFDQALADEVAARAAQANASAMRLKAEAAAQSAAAQTTEAAASVGAIGIIAGALVGLVIGAFAAHKQVEALIETLSGIKAPKFDVEYIAQYLQKANQVEEIQKSINLEVEKSISKYNSAADAAERVSKATKTHYEHLRKMNELSNASPAAKAAAALGIDKQERQANLNNKMYEQANLETEGKTLQGKAGSILSTVSSKEHDEQVVRLNKQKLDAADAAAEEIEKSKKDPGYFGLVNKRELFRAYNSFQQSGLTNPAGAAFRKLAGGQKVSSEDLDKAESQVTADRDKYKKAYQASVNQAHANDVTRKPGEEFAKQAASSFAKAAQLGLEIKDDKKSNNTTDQAEAAEAAAKKLEESPVGKVRKQKSEIKEDEDSIAAAKKPGSGVAPDELRAMQKDLAEKKKGLASMTGGSDKPVGLNAMQKLGSFTAQGGNPLVDLQKHGNALLQQLVSGQKSQTSAVKNSQGSVKH